MRYPVGEAPAKWPLVHPARVAELRRSTAVNGVHEVASEKMVYRVVAVRHHPVRDSVSDLSLRTGFAFWRTGRRIRLMFVRPPERREVPAEIQFEVASNAVTDITNLGATRLRTWQGQQWKEQVGARPELGSCRRPEPIDLGLRRGQRFTVKRGQTPDERIDKRVEVGIVQRAVHPAVTLRDISIEVVTAKHDLKCPRAADQTREPFQRSAARDQSDADLGVAEQSALPAGEAHVAGQHELVPFALVSGHPQAAESCPPPPVLLPASRAAKFERGKSSV